MADRASRGDGSESRGGFAAWPALALLLVIAAGSSYFVFKHPYQAAPDERTYLENARWLFSFDKGRMETWHLHYAFYSLVIGAPQKLIGHERAVGKVVNLLMHCAMSLLVFAFVRRRTDNPVAAPVAMALAGLAPPTLSLIHI